MSPYYVECEYEGCKTLVADAGAKRHYCTEHMKLLKLWPFGGEGEE